MIKIEAIIPTGLVTGDSFRLKVPLSPRRRSPRIDSTFDYTKAVFTNTGKGGSTYAEEEI